VLITGAAPPRAVGPAGRGVTTTIIAVAFADDAGATAAALAPLDACPVLDRSLVAERLRPSTMDGLFELTDGHFPARHRCLADTIWSNDAPVHVLTAVQDLMARAPSPRSRLLGVLPPPPSPDTTPPDGAFSMSAALFVAAYALWDNPEEDAINHGWHRNMMAALEPYAVGHYVGESDLVATPSRARASFAPPHWQRLQALRRRWDPAGVFHTF